MISGLIYLEYLVLYALNAQKIVYVSIRILQKLFAIHLIKSKWKILLHT